MRPSWIFVPLLSISLWLAGCAVTGKANKMGDFTVTNAFTTIQAGSAPVTLHAIGRNGEQVVNWTLTFGNVPCAPACGTLATSGTSTAVYTPPAVPPGYVNAVITVTSTNDRNSINILSFDITPALSVSITNKFSTQVAGGAMAPLTAVLTGDAAMGGGVTWTLTVGGTSCSPACGTLTPGTGTPVLTATYQSPATVPTDANASPTITATSVTNPSKSDSFTFSIISALGKLQGTYALLLRGYDLGGSPMTVAGSVTSDGKGNITAGEFDFDNGGGITPVAAPVAGTYTVDPTFNNATRGRITISTPFPGTAIGIAFDFVLSADGKHGRAVESDGSGFVNTGTFLQQDPASLTAAAPAGSFAFGLDSDSPFGGRIVEAGQFVLAGSAVTGGVLDLSKAANINPIYSAEPILSGPVTSPDSSGRGTLTLLVHDNSNQYAYYIINQNQLNLIEIDHGLKYGTVQAGVAYVQKIPFTPDSVNTTSVLQLTGMDAIPNTSNGVGPDVIIGVLTISGGNQFALTYDENDLGTVLIKHTANGTVSFDAATGRGVLGDVGGFENSFMDSSVFYLYDAGKGFMIDADISTCAPAPPAVPPGCVIVTTANAAITNNAFSGTFTSQASGPFKTSDINGNLIGGFGATALPNLPDMAAALTADGSSGTFNAIGDLDSFNPPGNIQNQAFGGTYSVDDPTFGHGIATLPAFIFGDFVIDPKPASFYMIGPNQFVVIGTQQGFDSGVSFVDPQ